MPSRKINFKWIIFFNAAIFIACVITNVNLFLYLTFFVFESLFGFLIVYIHGAHNDISNTKTKSISWKEYLIGALFLSVVILGFGYILLSTGYVLTYGSEVDVVYNYDEIGRVMVTALLFIIIQYGVMFFTAYRTGNEDNLHDLFTNSIVSFLVLLVGTGYWIIFGGLVLWFIESSCTLLAIEFTCSQEFLKNMVLLVFIVFKVYFHIQILKKESKRPKRLNSSRIRLTRRKR